LTEFHPYIYVEHSLRRPTSITGAAFTGAPWRFIKLPKRVLDRPTDGQSGWVSWLVRTHFRENHGECFLFGRITGYRWQRTRDQSVLLDTRGRITGVKHESFAPPSGSITVGNKAVSVDPEGTWHINSVQSRTAPRV
jgi:hypothetical protein